MSFNIVTDLSNSFHPYPKPKKSEKKVSKQIKKKSSKLAKKERNRFSILQSKKECFICKSQIGLDNHEAFGGCNRQKSMEWGLIYYLCRKCHSKATNDEETKKKLELQAEKEFKTRYGAELFLKEFGKNVIYKNGGKKND